jgi:hypothetical protein
MKLVNAVVAFIVSGVVSAVAPAASHAADLYASTLTAPTTTTVYVPTPPSSDLHRGDQPMGPGLGN